MSLPITSQRQKVLDNLRKDRNLLTDDTRDDSTIELAAPGMMRLYDFYEPSLQADTYTIHVNQSVSYPFFDDDAKLGKVEKYVQDFTLDLSGNEVKAAEDTTTPQTEYVQQFKVTAPQFKIDNKDVHSTYPPQGHADQPNVLPHIVFNDSHLPWARAINERSPDADDLMTWLAIFPFDVNGPYQELRLDVEQLKSLEAVLKPTDGNGNSKALEQSAVFTISMTLQQYMDLPKTTVGTSKPAKVHTPDFGTIQSDPDWASMQNDEVQVIFIKGSMFQAFFPTLNGKADTTEYRCCVHVRNVNTAGMPTTGLDDVGVFSILHSKRTGPTDIVQGKPPRSQAVHMISIEFVDQMKSSDIGDEDLVAFVSLENWTYLCQPPQLVNFIDSMRAIGEEVWNKDTRAQNDCLLRCSDATIAQVQDKIAELQGVNKADPMIGTLTSTLARLRQGYTVVRHHAASGQETIAWNRGPLIPVLGAVPLSANWPLASKDGQDYQIFDKQLSIMDLSYSSAWQVGKLLASSDLGFVAALMRHRSDLHIQGALAASVLQAEATTGFKSTHNTMSNLGSVVNAIAGLTEMEKSADLQNRWASNATGAAPQTGALLNLKPTVAIAAGIHMASAVATAPLSGDSSLPYNELAPANSTDWELIHKWILDKMYLSAIPAHYLVGDPSFLPTESMRFFHVDSTWIECLIDGALSIANHMADDDDLVRAIIKKELNNYFATPIETTKGSHYPQVPRYGFFLRSSVVTVYQDLIVDIPYPLPAKKADGSDGPDPTAGRSPVLVQKLMSNDILMVLLDRLPEQIGNIILQQPPHQQRFSAGDILEADYIEFAWRKVFPDASSPDFPAEMLHELGQPHRFDNKDNIYNWDTQCLNFKVMDDILFGDSGVISSTEAWKDWVTKGNTGHKLNSSIVAMQLNDTCKYLDIKNPTPPTIDDVKSQPYVLRTQKTPKGVSDARDKLLALKHASTPATLPVDSKKSISPTGVHANIVVSKATKPLTTKLVSGKEHAVHSPALQRAAASQKPAPAKPTLALPAPLSTTLAAQSIVSAIPSKVGSQHNPLFTYCVFPWTSKIPGKDKSFVFIDGPTMPDLIVAINITSGALFNPRGFLLQEIQIRIPLGDPKFRPNDAQHPLNHPTGMGLCPTGASGGSRARMLNNQRFVVHLDNEFADPPNEKEPIVSKQHKGSSPTYLFVRVIPRSLARCSPVERNLNLSFKLDEVDVAGLNLAKPASWTDQGDVNIEAVELYGAVGKNDQGFAVTSLKINRRLGWTDTLP